MHPQGLALYGILGAGEGVAIDGDPLQLELLAVEGEAAVAAGGGGVAPDVETGLHPGQLGVEGESERHMLDQELGRPVIGQAGGVGGVSVHRGLQGCGARAW